MNKTVVSEQSFFLVFFCFQFTLAVILGVPHTALIGIPVSFSQNTLDTISISKVAFQFVSSGIVNPTLPVLFSCLVDLSFVVAAVKVCDFRRFSPHLLLKNNSIIISKMQILKENSTFSS